MWGRKGVRPVYLWPYKQKIHWHLEILKEWGEVSSAAFAKETVPIVLQLVNAETPGTVNGEAARISHNELGH